MEKIEKDMTPKLLKDLGMRYPTENSKYKRRFGLYECQYCGKEFETQTQHIKSGNTKSCGCLNLKKFIERASTHHMSKTKLYKKWSDMKARCYNTKNKDYIHYGDRGITVCNSWREDYMNFYNWAMKNGYEESLSIDRIDVNLGYSPDNCRWATQYLQTQNIRDIKKNNTSGFRGVCKSSNGDKNGDKWVAKIQVDKKIVYLGCYYCPEDGARAYETYVRINKLDHTFTPILTEVEIEKLMEGQC